MSRSALRTRLRFLSTLPARGATNIPPPFGACPSISIHAPREGSDKSWKAATQKFSNFYPRSPRGERLDVENIPALAGLFLSTLPARGATFAS